MWRFHTRWAGPWKPWRRLIAALAIGAAVSACSTVEDLFGDDAPPPAKAARPGGTGVPGADQSTPNLSSVPGQAPVPQTTAEERKRLVKELAADNKGVKYAEPVAKPEQPNLPPPKSAPPRIKQEAAKDAKPVASVQIPGAAKSTPAEAQVAGTPQTTIIQGPSSTASAPPVPQTPPVPEMPLVSGSPVAPGNPVAPPPSAASPAPAPPIVSRAPPAPPPTAAQVTTQTPAMPPPPPALTYAAPPPLAPPASPPATASRGPRALETYPPKKMAISAQIGSVSFDANSAQMRAVDLAALREIATEQRKRGGTLRVVGYSQSPVSSERAEQVARTLVGNGVKPDRIYAGAMPQSDPGYLDLRPEAVSANRRVDIYIDY